MKGKLARSGLIQLKPSLARELSESRQALETWRNLEGDVEKEPHCPEAAALVIEAIRKEEKDMAYAAWAQVDHLLREQDLEQVKTQTLAQDIPTGWIENGRHLFGQKYDSQ